MEVWSDRGSTCKFRYARSAFRNLHVDPLSLHTSMRNKQVESNPYIFTLTTLSKLYFFGYEISFFNTKHPVIILRASLFVVTPSHVALSKIECQNFFYVYRSRKHRECKYIHMHIGSRLFELFSNDVRVNKKPGMYLMWMDKKNTIFKAILTDARGRYLSYNSLLSKYCNHCTTCSSTGNLRIQKFHFSLKYFPHYSIYTIFD